MEKIFKKFETLNQKSKTIEEAMILIPHRHALSKEITAMSPSSLELKDLEVQVKSSLKHHEEVLQQEYSETKQNMNRVQMKMMYLLNYLENQDQPSGGSQSQPHNLASYNSEASKTPVTPNIVVTQHFDEATPTSVVKKPPAAVFHYEVTSKEFEKIPSYMKGRVTIVDLQDFLKNVVIQTFKHKYRIMQQRRSTLKPNDCVLQSNFRLDAKLFEGEHFVSTVDIARTLEKNIDKKHDRFIQMLRHLQVIREARKNSLCCYIWKKQL
jgi:Spindle and kinetochore-associated protein 1